MAENQSNREEESRPDEPQDVSQVNEMFEDFARAMAGMRSDMEWGQNRGLFIKPTLATPTRNNEEENRVLEATSEIIVSADASIATPVPPPAPTTSTPTFGDPPDTGSMVVESRDALESPAPVPEVAISDPAVSEVVMPTAEPPRIDIASSPGALQSPVGLPPEAPAAPQSPVAATSEVLAAPQAESISAPETPGETPFRSKETPTSFLADKTQGFVSAPTEIVSPSPLVVQPTQEIPQASPARETPVEEVPPRASDEQNTPVASSQSAPEIREAVWPPGAGIIPKNEEERKEILKAAEVRYKQRLEQSQSTRANPPSGERTRAQMPSSTGGTPLDSGRPGASFYTDPTADSVNLVSNVEQAADAVSNHMEVLLLLLSNLTATVVRHTDKLSELLDKTDADDDGDEY